MFTSKAFPERYGAQREQLKHGDDDERGQKRLHTGLIELGHRALSEWTLFNPRNAPCERKAILQTACRGLSLLSLIHMYCSNWLD